MSIIDSVVAWFSPRRAYERQAWRNEYEYLRSSYDAGGYGRNNAPWRVYNDSAEMTDRSSREIIRARARDLERNSDMTNGIISAFVRNVVGKGYTLQCKTENEKLNSQIEELWNVWTKKQHCDVTGTQSLNQLLKMAVRRKKVDGGILFIKCYTGGKIPFQLQAIEVDELSLINTSPKKKGNKVINGIEYDSYNKPVGYWIQQYSLDGLAAVTPKYYPAERVIYIFDKKRPSQIREISDLAPSLPRARDANELIQSVSVKERIAACLSVFVKRQVPTQTGYGRGNNALNDPRMSYSGKSLSPGMITELNPGDEIQVVDPKNASNDATAFLKTEQRLMGAGQGLSYEAISRDMSQVNYSSARQGLIEDELTYDDEKEWVKQFLSEVFETFLISAVLAKAIDISDFWGNKEKYLKHIWVESPRRWIDPNKEANANKTAIETGQKTFKQVAAENGQDWKQMLDDMSEVIEYCEKKKINIGGGIYGQLKSKE